MEDQNQLNTPFVNKGDLLPTGANKRTRILRVVCNEREKELLFAKAKAAGLSLSAFLRGAAMDCKVVIQNQLPPEVLLLTARIAGCASSLNQLAKYNNQHIQFTPDEIISLFTMIEELRQVSNEIKNYLR